MAINFKKIWTGLTVVPKTATSADSKGELEVIDSTGKLQYHNGTSVSPVVTESHAANLTNKTLTSPVIDTGVSGTAIDTDPALTADSDTLLASQKAVKAYVDASSGDVQADVNDLITLTGVPANSTDLGTFTGSIIPDASDIKEALQALETAAETDATNLADHIADASDAHDASAISNVPAGTIAATDVQAAINELDGDIQGHITDATDAHDASAISVVPTGNLAATEVQAALVELQGDIDTINTTSLAAKVTGPASATDEAVARFDGTTGKLVQDSIVKITDAGVMTGLTGLTSSGTVNSTGTLIANGDFVEGQVTDSTATGANATITNPASPFVRLTNASLTSVDMISTPVSGEVITIENATGNTITINNNTGGTAANRILTGTKSALSLADESSITLKYDSVETRWMVIGGTGSGGGQDLQTVFQLTGTDVPIWSTGNNATFLGGGALAGTFAANTSTPLHGTSSYVYTQASGSLNDYGACPAQAVDPRFRGTVVTLFFPYTYNGGSSDIEIIVYDVTNGAIIPNSAFVQTTNGITIFKTTVTIPLTCASIRMGFQTRVANNGMVFAFDDVQLTANSTVYASVNNMTSTVTFTPTGSWTSNVSYTGTWSRSGEKMKVYFKMLCSAAPSPATEFFLNMPTGYVIDFSKLPSTTTAMVLGQSYTLDASSQFVPGQINYRNTTSVGISFYESGSIIGTDNFTPTFPFTFAVNDYIEGWFEVPIVGWTANSTNIVTAPETFNSDTATFTYAGSSQYTLSTLANAPVGTYITFTYAINTNTRTQTNAAAPTQTISSMNQNGIQVFTRAYNAASTSGSPAAVAINVGKGYKACSLSVYKNAGKDIVGSLDFWRRGTDELTGLAYKEYDEKTGILYLDGGFTQNDPAVAVYRYYFSDQTLQASGYITINASKNPALTGLNISAVAARGVNSSGSAFDGTGATLTYNSTKTFDTHGALNTTTGVFTCPDTGYYQVSTACQFQTASYSLNQVCQISFVKNGVEVASNGVFAQAAATFAITNRLTDVIFLTKGDTLSVSLFNTRGSTALNTNAIQNFFSITKTSVG